MRPMVLIAETIDPACARWLADRFEVRLYLEAGRGPSLGDLRRAGGLVVRTYTQVDEGLLSRAPSLKVVGRAGVGLDNIDLDACAGRGVKVVYTPHANTQAVVEYVLGLILDAFRPRFTLTQPVEPSEFHRLRREQVGTQLGGLTLGVLGFGRIGRRLGAVAHSLGMRLLVNDLLPAERYSQAVDYPFEFVDKPTLYQQSDVVSVHVDGRATNRGLISAEVFDQLKPHCLLINTARGMLVDHHALADWARSVADRGGRAVLDVHDPEPPAADNPLFGLANVRLLPHLASRTHDALMNMSWVVRDVAAVLEGGQPEYEAC